MTTEAWSSRVRHDSDATFREWGSELSSKLLAVGMTQTADTGQIDWGTVTRPSTNTSAGFEIWRFNDPSHSTSPIFLRLDYGTAGNADAPQLVVTMGTGSNGSGTITGTAISPARQVVYGTIGQTTDTLRNSYLVYNATMGFLGLWWKVGSGHAHSMLFIARTVDADGEGDTTGALMVWANTNVGSRASQAFRFLSPATVFTVKATSASMQLCIWPQSPSSSIVGSDYQVALAFTITPRVQPLSQLCGTVAAEIADATTFNATMVGSTPRTYLALDGTATFMDASGTLRPAMLWE